MGSLERKFRRQQVRQWTSHQAVIDFQKAAAGGMEAYRTALVAKRMIAELARELHGQALIDLTDRNKFQILSREIFGDAEGYSYSGDSRSEQSKDVGETDAETESIHSGVRGGPVERDSSSDQSGVCAELSEGDSLAPAGEPGDQVGTGTALHGPSGVDLLDSKGQSSSHPEDSEGRVE